MSQVRQYELIYVVSSDATDQQIADLHTQVEEITGRYSGTLDKTENWGRRKLAYEIGPHKEGDLRPRSDHRVGRADEGNRSPPARQRPGDPPSHRPRGRGEPRHRARAHAAQGRLAAPARRPRPAAGAAARRRPAAAATMTTIGLAATSRRGFSHARRTRTLIIIIGQAAADAAATRRTTRSARCSGAGRSASSARTRSTTSTTRTSSCWDPSCRSAARFCRAASRAPARRISASCRRPSSARASSR